MKKFRFRLERVLQYRSLIRAEKKRLVMLKTLEVGEAEEHLKDLQEAYLANVAGGKIMSAEELSLYGNYAALLKEKMKRQMLRIEELKQELEALRQAYIEATREEESLLRLKQRRTEEYRDYVLVEEGKFLDELTVQRTNLIKKRKGSIGS